MADLRKLKRRNTLGAPPPLEEASHNLKAPEVAPATPPPRATGQHVATHQILPSEHSFLPTLRDTARLDGRTLRKTGRTLQLATKVSWEFDDKLRRIAQRDRKMLVEVLELALDAYEKERDSEKVAAI
jgi:hypothetical protein